MKRTMQGFAALVLAFGMAGPSYASVIYNVSRTIGAGGVAGTIETDGTIGTLVTANITDWNLVLNDGTNMSTLLGPSSGSNSVSLVKGLSFSATATELLFNFSSTGYDLVLFQKVLYSGNNYWCLGASIGGTCGPPTPGGEHVQVLQYPNLHQGVARQGTSSIATVAVPEPTTVALLGLALAGLGFARKRPR